MGGGGKNKIFFGKYIPLQSSTVNYKQKYSTNRKGVKFYFVRPYGTAIKFFFFFFSASHMPYKLQIFTMFTSQRRFRESRKKRVIILMAVPLRLCPPPPSPSRLIATGFFKLFIYTMTENGF